MLLDAGREDRALLASNPSARAGARRWQERAHSRSCSIQTASAPDLHPHGGPLWKRSHDRPPRPSTCRPSMPSGSSA